MYEMKVCFNFRGDWQTLRLDGNFIGMITRRHFRVPYPSNQNPVFKVIFSPFCSAQLISGLSC